MDETYWVQMERDVVAARGPEAAAFLQGQLSQDVLGIAEGGHAWSWLLAPDGKVVALVRVWRQSAEDWFLDTDAGWGEVVLARLQRFKLRTKVDLSQVPASIVGFRGPGWDAPVENREVLVAAPPWPGMSGADVLSLLSTDSATPDGPRVEAAEYEVDRILAGMPRMGAELTDRTIPGETGLVALTVSFTKGCYTGQELVARVDSRGGNVPRHLRALRFADGVEPGSDLYDGDVAIGSVTSAAHSADGSRVGLGYIKRGYEPPHAATAGPNRVPTEVVALP